MSKLNYYSSVWVSTVNCQLRTRKKRIPACQHLAFTVKMWLIRCPWILKTALSVNGASDSRREKTQVAGLLQKRGLWWVYTMMNWISNCGCGYVLWIGSDELSTHRTRGDGMNEQGRDGITAAVIVSDHQKCRMATWGGSLGYHLHEVNMHVVHISKYAHVWLCERREKRKNV